jgi:hypothetical protein
MEVPEPHAERQGDRDGDRQCGAREHEVLPRLLEDESALVDDELSASANTPRSRLAIRSSSAHCSRV